MGKARLRVQFPPQGPPAHPLLAARASHSHPRARAEALHPGTWNCPPLSGAPRCTLVAGNRTGRGGVAGPPVSSDAARAPTCPARPSSHPLRPAPCARRVSSPPTVPALTCPEGPVRPRGPGVRAPPPGGSRPPERPRRPARGGSRGAEPPRPPERPLAATATESVHPGALPPAPPRALLPARQGRRAPKARLNAAASEKPSGRPSRPGSALAPAVVPRL